MIRLPTIDRLLSVLNEAVDFATYHPVPAAAIVAAYVWLLLAMLRPVERP